MQPYQQLPSANAVSRLSTSNKFMAVKFGFGLGLGLDFGLGLGLAKG